MHGVGWPAGLGGMVVGDLSFSPTYDLYYVPDGFVRHLSLPSLTTLFVDVDGFFLFGNLFGLFSD